MIKRKTILSLAVAAITSNVLAVNFAYAGNGSIAVNESGFIPPTGVSSNQSVAVGGGSTGASDNGTATGFNTHAGVGGTAYGSNTTADHGATALGANSYAAGTSVVIGSGSTGDGLGGVWGNNSSTGTAQNAWVIGNGITATRSNEVAVGGKTIGQVGTATQADQVTNLGQVNNIANQTLNSANQYTDNVAAQTLNSANTYTDTEISKIKITGGAPVAAVDYTNTTSNDLVLNSNGGAGTTISNVADGVQNHDAANMGQLRSVQSQLNGRIDGLQKRVDGVGAMAAAQSNIVYNPYGSRFQLGLGIGGMGQSQAIAVRAMIASQNRHYIWSVGASTATNGGTSFGGGVSISF
ncbi:hypothetical protein [Burkholderia sp. LMG 13014]|uniref:hypothetical protein n=1 Tax=Burkholderia sp. LMG 13014 TaxID=2709306 RepID=UPI00196451B3|nr:hypothetical protein [Burkholderia sp. LMG 13014]